MTEAMRSRGPDDEGLFADGWVTLGHRRLTIIDLSDAGGQPMVRDDLGLALVFNGCIYNYPRAARGAARAPGYRFHSTSDTEVILVAYAHWGERFVDHLVGMFAIGLVDRRRRRLVLARDRLGIKPLYLAETPGGCGSPPPCPRCCAAGDVDTGIDPVALHHYLSWHSIVPAPRTVLRGVRKLPPATLRVIEADGRSREERLLATRLRAGARRRGDGRRRLAGRRRGRAARGGTPTAGRRRAGRGAALRRPGLQPDRGAARRGRPAAPADVQHRLRQPRRRVRRRVPLLRPGGPRVRHRPPPDPAGRRRPGARRTAGRAGDDRADGQPRRGRLPPALRAGRAAREGGPVRPGRRRGVRRLRLPPATGRGAPARRRRDVRRRVLRPRPRRAAPASSARRTRWSTTPAGSCSPGTSPRPGRRPRWTPCCAWTPT